MRLKADLFGKGKDSKSDLREYVPINDLPPAETDTDSGIHRDRNGKSYMQCRPSPSNLPVMCVGL